MRLDLKEDPKAWRKAALLGLIGPSVILGLLRHRHIISTVFLAAALSLLILAGLIACLRPQCFRGYYRFTARLGFYLIQALGRIVLTTIFFVILTPFACVIRLLGKDLLQLKPPRDPQTFWQKARPDSSLDSMY
jgi:hypothetical protein